MTDPRTELKVKKAKELAFSENVKLFHKPKIDENKRRESESLMQPTRKKQRPKKMLMGEDGEYTNYSLEDAYGEYEKKADPKQEGERNRRYLKQYVR